ncbi:MAG: hypothetical protein KDB07_06605 [Planctomycetes bacterium]|nr:hypothetical protein [Planctomycetota bacterium]
MSKFISAAYWQDLDIFELHRKLESLMDKAHEALTDMYGPAQCGSFRAGFYDPESNQFIKIPTCSEGVFHNLCEYEQYQEYCDGRCWPVHLAYCEWDIELSEKFGLPVLRMEAVEDWADEYSVDTLPEWCFYIDGLQVGLNSRGDLVAFDYALPV